MAGDVTEADVLDALGQRYAPPAFGFLTHVPTGTGAAYERTIDAVAMSLWPSRGYQIIGIEVKVHRSDWLRELQAPRKAEAAFRCVDLWYVVAPPDVIKIAEVPKGWGYFEYRAPADVNRPETRAFVQIKAAAERRERPIDRAFMAACFRKVVAADADPHRFERLYERKARREPRPRDVLARELRALSKATEAVRMALFDLDELDREAARRPAAVAEDADHADRTVDPGV